MRQESYFNEEQRWPSRSQRFGWIVGVSVVTFIAFQLNLHINAPLIAVPVLVVMVLLLLTVLTIQQRLSVRIGSDAAGPISLPLVGRFRRKPAQTNPDDEAESDPEPVPVLRITHILKSPVSALAPGRRGSRLGRSEQTIPLTDVERWFASRVPRFAQIRRDDTTFPVGFQRNAVTIVLVDGRQLTIPTRMQPDLLQALTLSRVDAERREHATVREEL